MMEWINDERTRYYVLFNTFEWGRQKFSQQIFKNALESWQVDNKSQWYLKEEK